MVYDASGNRVLKTERKMVNGFLAHKSVADVDDELAYELEGINLDFELKSGYIPNGEGRFDIDEDFDVDKRYFFIKDHLGTTRLVVDEDGEIEDAEMYTAYGVKEPLVSTSGLNIKKKFTGKEFDDDGMGALGEKGMGLYYFGKRYYDPEIIRWIRTDPAEEFWDLYNYVGGNPLSKIDPNGAASRDQRTMEILYSQARKNGTVKAFHEAQQKAGVAVGIGFGVVGGVAGSSLGIGRLSAALYTYRYQAGSIFLFFLHILNQSKGAFDLKGDPDSKPSDEPSFGKEPEVTVENPEETNETPEVQEVIPPPPPPPPPENEDDNDNNDDPNGTVTPIHDEATVTPKPPDKDE